MLLFCFQDLGSDSAQQHEYDHMSGDSVEQEERVSKDLTSKHS